MEKIPRSKRRRVWKTPKYEPLPPGPRLIGYARVSTEDQSLSMQEAALRRGGVIDRYINVEKVSASAVKRPVLERIINGGLRPGDILVVWKLDRLARSMSHMLEVAEKIRDAGASFRSLTEQIDTNTPGGVFMFHMLAAAAQLERDLIRERTREGVRIAKLNGTRFGQPPKCSWDQRRQVQEWRKREGLPVRAIVERIKERFGIEVSATAVTNYLRKPLGEKPSDE